MNVFAKAILIGILHHPSKDRVIAHYELETNGDGINGVKVWGDYAKFIALKILNGDFESCRLVPSKQINKMWKLHILDTYTYAEFCRDIFPPLGPLIHHDHIEKYFSYEEMEERRMKTKILYRKAFNEECTFFNGENQYKLTVNSSHQTPFYFSERTNTSAIPSTYNTSCTNNNLYRDNHL